MKRNSAGFSMMEVVITIAVIGIFFAAVAAVFSVIGRGVMVTRTRTVATNLAQEKIESLKNVSYPRLRATSSSDLSTYGFDNTYYPPENGILVGDIPYKRYVIVKRAKDDGSGQLVDGLPDEGDTGIKRITITVEWQEKGAPSSMVLSNLLQDPNRRPLDATITGTVSDGAGIALPGARISIVDNSNWSATTDPTGTYTLKIPTGTYQVQAAKDTYWSALNASQLFPSGSTTVNFTLAKMLTGTIKGKVFFNNHLVISEVCAGTEPVTGSGVYYKWIELYNPTAVQWTVTPGDFRINYASQSGPNGMISVSNSNLQIINTVIPPYGYYLIANTPSFILSDGTSVNADAVCTLGNDFVRPEAWGFMIFCQNPITSNGAPLDMMGWTWKTSTSVPPFGTGGGIRGMHDDGLPVGFVHRRFSYPGGYAAGQGNAFFSNDNVADFDTFVPLSPSNGTYPRNSSATAVPVSGGVPGKTVSLGGLGPGGTSWQFMASCDDGVSAPVMMTAATSTFIIPNVSTGTRTVNLFYNEYISPGYKIFRSISNVQVLAPGTTTHVANADTSPAWPAAGLNHVILTDTTENGVVQGRVVNAGVGVPDIRVESNGKSMTTGSAGKYYLTLPAGTPTLIVNPGNMNGNYTSKEQQVTVQAGAFTTVSDINISPGGAVTGRVLSNSGDYLPDVLVIAYDSLGNEARSSLTGNDGSFVISNLASGNTYSVRPALDSGESSTPESSSVFVTQGSTNWTSSFTVTSAYGNITGSVTNNGKAINAGVLIIASTGTIPSDPPPIDYAFRNSTMYYGTVSHSDGKYLLPVRGGFTYRVAAWFIPQAGSAPSRKDASSVTATAGDTTTIDFSWP